MYETIKTVNGYDIVRMKVIRGCYHVKIREFKKGYEERVFKTIKAAVAFCETL